MTEVARDKKGTRRTERPAYAKHGDASKPTISTDTIRKEAIVREKKLRADWWRKYGHLTGETLHVLLAEECEKAALPPDTFERKRPDDLVASAPIPLPASPPIPQTTSAVIGWRSARPEYNVEFLGPLFVSTKTTIEPPLHPGEFRLTQQKFIFLG